MSSLPFTDLPLSKEVQKSLADLGFETATAIQGESIPVILEGRDVLGQSRTGTGKTLAFAIPAVEKVDPKIAAVQALILCPTRELCIQVAEEVAKVGQYKKGLHPLPIFGGQPYDRQIRGLKRGAQVVIGTPGRLIDHLQRGTLQLDQVSLLILDEADEMLDMGFQDELETILKDVPKERQTLLFSATISREIKKLASSFLNDPAEIRVTPDSLSVPSIEQGYLEVRGPHKLEALTRLLDFHDVKLAIIFCNTKIGVDELVAHLQARGYASEGLHGDHKQAVRDRIMGKFRSGQVEVLVATDVASRGIDVKDIELVVNYDLPKDEEDYVHRIGRTGRAGKTGRALSFASGRDLFRLRNIERVIKKKIPRLPVPTLDQVEAAQQGALLDKVREHLAAPDLARYMPYVEALAVGETTLSDVACALFRMAAPPNAGAAEVDFGSATEERGGGDYRGRDAGGKPKGKFRRDPFGEGPMEKIFLNIGRVQGVDPKSILGALAGETGLPGKIFGNIEIQPKGTLVEVAAEHVNNVIQKFQNVRMKGHKVKSRKARE